MLLRGAANPRWTDASRSSEDRELFALRTQLAADFRVGRHVIRYKSSIVFRPDEQNRDDVLEASERWNLKSITRKDTWIDLSENFPLRYYLHTKRGAVTHTTFARYREDFRAAQKLRDSVQPIKDFCAGILYYSASQFTNPSLCPPSFEVDQDGDLRDVIGSRSRQHVRFMYELYTAYKRDEQRYKTYLSVIAKSGIGLLNKIKWKESDYSTRAFEVHSGGKVINKKRIRKLIIPTIEIGDVQLSFNQLSEGTFRTMALLFYIITGRYTLLLIEEPEVCVHHGLLHSVVEIIKEFAKDRQIIFSTHSEAVLDSLHPEQVRLVRSQAKLGTLVAPISKVMSVREFQALKEYLQNMGSLGEYWRRSGFPE